MPESLDSDPLNMFYLNTSPPDNCIESQWTKWLSSDFIPALIRSNTITRAAIYREVGFAMIPNPTNPLRYVILFQTDFRRLQDSEKYKQVFERTDAIKTLSEQLAETRNYRLIQNYNPNGVLNSKYQSLLNRSNRPSRAIQLKQSAEPAPNILSVEMDPDDKLDFEEWYREELLPKISTLTGYIRSRRYQLSSDTAVTITSPYLALHEIQDLNKAFVSQKAHEEASTPRMEKHIEASEKRKTEKGGGFIRRGWELIHAEGYPTSPLVQGAQGTRRNQTQDATITSY